MQIRSPLRVAQDIAVLWCFSKVPIPFGLAPWVFGFGMGQMPRRAK